MKNKSLNKALLILKQEGWSIVKLGKIYAGDIVEKTINLSKIE